jgi:hypothetical protein
MTPWEQQRREWCLQGHAVLANKTCDQALIRWARAQGKLCLIARPSVWGNPQPLNDPNNDEERLASLEAYGPYLERRPDLQARLPELRGKVLVCWCTPRACHGDILLAWWEPHFAAEYLVACQAQLRMVDRRNGTNMVQLELW